MSHPRDREFTTADTDTMTEFSKWVSDASPNDPACQVAVRTIASRLAAVQYYLPLAALHPEDDIEHVHQLRVSTRRTVAAVMLYREFLPKGPRKDLCRELKRIRRAAGSARDFDVMVQRHRDTDLDPHAEHFLDGIRRKRRRAQKPLRAVYDSCREHNVLDQILRRIIKGTRARCGKNKTPRFGRWARRQLRRAVRAFFRAEPDVLDDLESLHEFRILGKELRYAMELLAAAFPPAFQTELYPLVERIQERLGEINDHTVALHRFHHWKQESTDKLETKHLKELIKAEKKALRQSLWQFARWWTPKRSRATQGQFRKMINGKS